MTTSPTRWQSPGFKQLEIQPWPNLKGSRIAKLYPYVFTGGRHGRLVLRALIVIFGLAVFGWLLV